MLIAVGINCGSNRSPLASIQMQQHAMCPNIRANDTDTFFFDAAGSAPTESETGMSLSLSEANKGGRHLGRGPAGRGPWRSYRQKRAAADWLLGQRSDQSPASHRPATGQQLGHAHIRLSLDIRSPLDATVDALEVALREDFVGLARGEPTAFVVLPPGGRQPLTVAWQTDPVSATRFHPDCIAAVRDAAHSVLVQRSRR